MPTSSWLPRCWNMCRASPRSRILTWPTIPAKVIRLQRDARIRCAVFFSGSIRFQISTSMTTVSSTSHGSPHRTAVPRPTFIMAVMIFPPRLTSLRVFSKDDISHLRFFTHSICAVTELVCADPRVLEKPHLCGLPLIHNSLQAPYTSVSSTCGYSFLICSLWETVRISPLTVAAAKNVPRFGARSYFSKS